MICNYPNASVTYNVEVAVNLFSSGPDFIIGNEKKRVSIAGILAMNPECLIFDEVTSMLDPESGIAVLEIVKRLHRKGKTIVYITHNLEELHDADRVLVMDKGKIRLEGAPENIFSDISLLNLGLTLPSLIELAESLKTHGIVIPWEKTSSPKSFAEEICRLFLKT